MAEERVENRSNFAARVWNGMANRLRSLLIETKEVPMVSTVDAGVFPIDEPIGKSLSAHIEPYGMGLLERNRLSRSNWRFIKSRDFLPNEKH